MTKIKIGSDFSGVGAFNQALIRLSIEYEEVFACDMDKFARQTFIANYGEPKYFPTNVYSRIIPEGPLDIYVTSPPCQAFSLAGKRKGEDDKRGILFYNSHEFIKINKPRYFIFENVKGLLSDDEGRTFQKWINYLGGKSINGSTVLFPDENSVPYHIYFQVLNAKDYNIPQNRERIFIVGIRDDADNNFTFPKEQILTKRLKDVLEENVDDKYYLSEKAIEHIYKKEGVYTGINEDPIRCLTTRYSASIAGTFLKVQDSNHNQGVGECEGIAIGAIRGRNPDNPKSRESGLPTQQMLEINNSGLSNCLTTVQKDNVLIEPRSNVVAKLPGSHEQNSRIYGIDGISPTLTTMQGGGQEPKIHTNYRIRKLTPLECFRLMDFPDSLVENARKVGMSDSQLYKQAGNSICVGVLSAIISKFKINTK